MQHLHRTPGIPRDAARRRFLARALIAIAALVSMMALAACGGAAPTAPSAPAAPAASPAASPRMASPGAPGAASPGVTAGGPGAMTATVDMGDDLKYAPEHVTIKKGGSITWKNSSGVVHTATDDPSKATTASNAKLPAGAKTWDSGNIDPNGTFSHTFDTAGDYTYFCVPHESAGMVGTITVQP